MAVLSIAAGALLLYEGRNSTFQFDEWIWLLNRGGHSAGVFLNPHNGNLSAVPILIYKAFFRIFGATSTLPFRFVDVLLATACALLVYVLVSRRLGGWIGLAAAATLLFFGPGWNDLLWGFQIGYLASLAAGFGALLALDRADRKGDIAAAILLVVSVGSSSVGLMMLAGVVVELALLGRTAQWRRLWVPALPILLYGIWYLTYGIATAQLSRLDTVPLFAFQGLSAAAGSIVGLATPTSGSYGPLIITLDPGTTIAVLLLVAVGLRVISGAPLSPRFWGMGAVLLAFWIAAGLSYQSFRPPNSSRYAYPVAAFLIVAGSEFCSRWRPTRRATLLVAATTLAAVTSNLGFLRAGAREFANASEYARAELGALEIARGTVAPSFQLEAPSITAKIGFSDMIGIEAGPYFRAIDAFGSPADSAHTLLRDPEPAREAADLVLATAERLALIPSALRRSVCSTRKPQAGRIELAAGPETVLLKPKTSSITGVMARRFATSYRYVSLGAIAKNAAEALTLPHDELSVPWHVRLISSSAVLVCASR